MKRGVSRAGSPPSSVRSVSTREPEQDRVAGRPQAERGAVRMRLAAAARATAATAPKHTVALGSPGHGQRPLTSHALASTAGVCPRAASSSRPLSAASGYVREPDVNFPC